LLGVKGLLKSIRELVDIEGYARLDSPVHRLDPRVKLVATLFLVFTAVIVRSVISMLLLLVVILLIALLSRLPIRTFLGRATFVIPFFAGIIALPVLFITPGVPLLSLDLGTANFVITEEGFSAAAHFVFRVWLCVASVIVLLLTTEFPMLVRGLEKLRVPKVFTMMLSITFRYIFLSIDELLRMLRAKEARTFGRLGVRGSVKLAAGVISTSLARSFERGERVYQAMVARGFDWSFRTLNDLKLRPPGVIGGFLLILASTTILLADMGIIFPGIVPTLRGYMRILTGW